jgi:4-hydroxy-tetrahydrodipicolinate reductase
MDGDGGDLCIDRKAPTPGKTDMKTIRAIQIGMGPLGQKTVSYLLERRNIEIVGAVDVNPDLAGEDVAEIAGWSPIGVTIQGSLDDEICRQADCAILTTVSTMEQITPQILDVVRRGIPVVSTCEELFYPWERSPELAQQIDTAAKENQVAVVGTGINPGFLMDTLPSFLTAVCQKVDSVKVSRYQDAAFRRLPFQKKIGAGQTKEAFAELVAKKKIRHVALTESLQMIAHCLGWKLSATDDIIEPVITEQAIESDAMSIEAGGIAGVRQIGKGYVDDVEKITLDFKASIGEPNPRDHISIKGKPNIDSTIEGGVNGDVATCAITINTVRQVIRATPGLHTTADISPVTFFE